MKRKEFISKTISAGFLPVVLNGFSLQAFADSPLVSFLNKAGNEDRVLVLIQLNGGNDGLNTVIPLDQYSKYYSARTNIAIQENKVLGLGTAPSLGLHPAMSKMKNMYEEGKIGLIQNVGYPNQDFSHFRSTDIWLTGSNADEELETGWMGRYLDTKFPGFPTNYPNSTHPDPPAIQIGAMISPAFQGANMSLGMSITDPTNFYQFVEGTVDPAPNTPYGHELTFVRLVAQQTQQYSGSIKAAADKATNKSTLYPTAGTNTLADQLKIVARLIAGGLKTRVYMVSLGGFDTHATQVANGSTDTGAHATLLGRVSDAVNAFQDDLKLLAIDHRVLGMTFSEFGRRIKSNDSMGTDHGAAAPLFMFGAKVNGGIYGKNVVIPDEPSPGDNLPMEFDFRAIYASILKDWFEVSDADLGSIMRANFPIIPVINTQASSLRALNEKEDLQLSNYPNPAQTETTIKFSSTGGLVQIVLFDSSGKEMMVIVNEPFAYGAHEVSINVSHLPQGVYFYQMVNGNRKLSKKLLIAHR
jgi:uncharacterized protein (DUF1501 family)